MISSLNGKLIFKEQNTAVIECGGVGFKCAITSSTYSGLGNIGDNQFLFTHLSVREDALDLFGFLTREELEAFKLITSVSGVGPKIGIAILSVFSADKVCLFIASGDAKALTAASGVGIKLAQRIILELKDKIGSVSATAQNEELLSVGNASSNTNSKEAIEALSQLGYTRSEAALAVGRLDPALNTDELIKQALKTLGGRF